MDEPINPAELKQYLLGELSAEESLAMERRFLDDENFEAELLAAEQDWIDSYIAGELSATESRAFRRWMSGHHERVQRVRLAKTFFQVASPQAHSDEKSATWTWRNLIARPGSYRYAAVFTALLLVMTSILWVSRHNETAANEARIATSGRDSVVGAAVFPKRPERLPTYTSVLLAANEATKLEIRASIELVSLQMKLPRQSRKHPLNAQLFTSAGEIVWQAKGMAGRALDDQNRLSLWIPASQLKEGTYTVRIESDGVRSTFQLQVHRG